MPKSWSVYLAKQYEADKVKPFSFWVCEAIITGLTISTGMVIGHVIHAYL